MLYQRWRQVADQFGRELALLDVQSGCRWTFGQLATLSEKALENDGPVVYPQGSSSGFIFTVLRGWRLGRVICPLEPGQESPRFDRLPPHARHLKVTSASTGPARLIGFAEDQLMADAANIVATMGLRPDWPNAAAISLAHSYGFSNLVLPLLLHGIPLILAGGPLPEGIRKLSVIAPAITLPAVPAIWHAWSDVNVIGPQIRLAISAGAALPLSLEQHVLEKFGLKIHNFYGASECGGIAYDRSEKIRSDSSCVGAPLENVTVSLGDSGCLEVCSAAVGQSYWPVPSPELAAPCYRTSDLAELRDGLVYLRGRQTDTINLAGRKVSPDDVEHALLSHPLVRQCVVFGVPSDDSSRGELVVACVALHGSIGPDALRDFLLDKVPDWQVPRAWWFVDELPVNARGKIPRAEWRKRYLDR